MASSTQRIICKSVEERIGKKERHRGWVGTLNNYTEEECKKMEDTLKGKVKFFVCGKEIAPETGTPHLQMCVVWKQSKTLTATKKNLCSKRWHLDIKRGSDQANLDYCSKESLWLTFGKPCKQGKRSDLEDIYDAVESGASMDDVIEMRPNYQGLRAAQLLIHRRKPPPRKTKRKILWFWGATGTGKSRTARDILGDDCWVSQDTAQWFEGYEQQKGVILDDIRGDFSTFSKFLRITELWVSDYKVEVKGGSAYWNPDTIIITSDRPPEQCWDVGTKRMKQLLRRIETIVHFPELPTEELVLARRITFREFIKESAPPIIDESENDEKYPEKKYPEVEKGNTDFLDKKMGKKKTTPSGVGSYRKPLTAEHRETWEEESNKLMAVVYEGEVYNAPGGAL